MNTKLIGQYFNIENFVETENDYDYFNHDHPMEYIGYQQTSSLLSVGVSRLQSYTVQQHQVCIFKNRFMDLSSFSFFNFGDMLTYYSVHESPIFTDMKTKQGYLFTTVLRQSNYTIEEQWQISSIDEAIAMIGGYSSLIWGTLMFCIGGYQTFKMESSFAKTLYTRQAEHPKQVRTRE